MDIFTREPIESAIRFALFAGVLVLLALAESLAPRRRLTAHKPIRWLSNLGLVSINAIALRLLLPLGAAGIASLVRERGWGVLNYFALPSWFAVVVSVIVLDFVIYLQHVLFHAVPALWRVHMVHHADLDLDVSTGLRFHTIEILLSMGIKLATIVALGPPAAAVLIFEILLNVTSMFSHSNLRLPVTLDRIVRIFVVTPDMHRVHHSATPRETNSNFGFNLPWWDRLLGTYRAEPADGHDRMTIGLAQFRDERVERLHWMLALPFIGDRLNGPLGAIRRASRAIIKSSRV